MAGVLKHTWSSTIKNDSGSAVVSDAAVVVPGDAEENFSVDVDPGVTMEIDLVVPVTKLQSAFLSSDKAVTVNTNAADATGGQTIALVAGRAFAWNILGAGMGSNPFTPTITKFFIINAGSTVAKVRGGFLLKTL